MKLKVGDRVRIAEGVEDEIAFADYSGLEGTVSDIDFKLEYPVYVQLGEEHGEVGFTVDELEEINAQG